MNDDIITRLQDLAFRLHPDSDVGSALCDAADEIWELRRLITAWADACILMERTGSLDTTTPEGVAAGQALIALRKAVGR